LARFVYVDESGISGGRQEPWLVVAAVIVHGDHQLDSLYDALHEIVQKRVPEEFRTGLVLHASDVYGGNGKIFDPKHNPYWALGKRLEILADLAALPERLNLHVASGIFRRSDSPDIDNVHGHVIAYLACLIEVELWFRAHAKAENCMVIAEDNQAARKLIREYHAYNQDRAREIETQYLGVMPFRRIREDPAFQAKKPSHPLVLADFLAFATKRKVMEDKHIDDLCRPWWKRNAALNVTVPHVPGQ
jgi:hypothetical protein